MKGKLIWSIFWALIGVFVIAVSMFLVLRDSLVGEEITMMSYIFFTSVGVALTGLGVTLLIMTAKTNMRAGLKKFLLLTEASFVGFPVFVILHNAVSALLNTEEAIFFTLATIFCPLGFLVGAVGTIVLAIKSKPSVPAGTS